MRYTPFHLQFPTQIFFFFFFTEVSKRILRQVKIKTEMILNNNNNFGQIREQTFSLLDVV